MKLFLRERTIKEAILDVLAIDVRCVDIKFLKRKRF